MKSEKPIKSVVDSISHPDWAIKGWKIAFLFSERQLAEIKKISCISDWYADPVVIDTYIERLSICFNSIEKFHSTFGILPQVGDRLFNEETGMIVKDRAIDGGLMTITFTVSV